MKKIIKKIAAPLLRVFRQMFPRTYFSVYHYVRGYDWLRRFPEWQDPEASLYELKLPESIDTIFDVGCGNGRNLIPFRGKLKLQGIDLIPKDKIEWMLPPNEVDYEQCSVEEFVKKASIDMSRTFVYSHGTIYLSSKKTQNDFYDFCKKCGCRNFLFEEFTSESVHHPTEYFQLPFSDFIVEPLYDELFSFRSKN